MELRKRLRDRHDHQCRFLVDQGLGPDDQLPPAAGSLRLTGICVGRHPHLGTDYAAADRRTQLRLRGFEGQTCGAGQPKWRHVLNTTWSTPWSGLELVARWRYIGAVQSDTASSNPILNKNLPIPSLSNIPGYSYVDLSASVSFAKMFRLTVGANNVLDKDPPLITGSDCAAVSGTPGVACNGNTWPGTYDSLGRYLYARLSATF